MDIYIQNWPENSILKTILFEYSIPVLTFIVSLCAIYYTRREFLRNNRPYVFAMNFSFTNNEGILVFPIEVIGFKVLNNPAKIIKQHIKVEFNRKIIYEAIEKDFIRYPFDNTQWTNYIDLTEIKDDMNFKKGILERNIQLKYSTLDRGKHYNFLLIQEFDFKTSFWKDKFLQAN